MSRPERDKPSPARPGRLSDDPSVAGRGARIEHARRVSARAERISGRVGRLGGIVAALTREPSSTEAWSRGAKGERRVAAALDRLLREQGVILFHDRSIPGRRANLDHIAIGPGGVTLIDAKNLSGKIRVQRRGGLRGPQTEHLTVGGRDRSNLVEGVIRLRAIISDRLTTTEFDGVDLCCVLCIVDVGGLPLFGDLSVGPVRVVNSRGAARIAARHGGLDALAVRRLSAIIDAAFPPYA